MSTSPTLAQINDAFRARIGVPTFGDAIPGRFVFTQGIQALSPEAQIELWSLVRDFDDFTEENDPYGEHDVGVIEHPEAGTVFWKIDYYDPTLSMGSEDPLDLSKTCRVLTILLAEEW